MQIYTQLHVLVDKAIRVKYTTGGAFEIMASHDTIHAIVYT